MSARFLNSTATEILPLGLNASAMLDSTGNPSNKIVCMSSDACSSIVDQKFEILGTTFITAECSDLYASKVIHLTDTQLQTLMNAVP